MKSKTTYVYYAIKTKILIEAYGYFGRANCKLNTLMAILGKQTKKYPGGVLLFYPGGDTFSLPQWGHFYLEISEYIFRSNLRNRRSQLR